MNRPVCAFLAAICLIASTARSEAGTDPTTQPATSPTPEVETQTPTPTATLLPTECPVELSPQEVFANDNLPRFTCVSATSSCCWGFDVIQAQMPPSSYPVTAIECGNAQLCFGPDTCESPNEKHVSIFQVGNRQLKVSCFNATPSNTPTRTPTRTPTSMPTATATAEVVPTLLPTECPVQLSPNDRVESDNLPSFCVAVTSSCCWRFDYLRSDFGILPYPTPFAQCGDGEICFGAFNCDATEARFISYFQVGNQQLRVGCVNATPSSTTTATPTVTPSRTPSATATPAATVSVTASPTSAPSATATTIATPNDTPTAAASPAATGTPVETATTIATPNDTPTATNSPPPTATTTAAATFPTATETATTPSPTSTANPPTATPLFCAGDCNDSGDVNVAELIRAVSIALGNLPLDTCRNADIDGNGRIAINELLIAVRNALDGC